MPGDEGQCRAKHALHLRYDVGNDDYQTTVKRLPGIFADDVSPVVREEDEITFDGNPHERFVRCKVERKVIDVVSLVPCRTIVGVNQAAGETGTEAGRVLTSAQRLSEQAQTLRTDVESFLAKVRAA